MLGYIPDRAYYFTVARTVDLGIMVWSPVNLCPPNNVLAPLPGAGRRDPPLAGHRPPEVDAPPAADRRLAVQVGTNLLYIGGSDGTAAQADGVRRHDAGSGNLDTWKPGPRCRRLGCRRSCGRRSRDAST